MEIYQIVLEKLLPIIQKFKFKIIESGNDFIRLESINVSMTIVFNDRIDHTNYFLIGRNRKTEQILTNKLLKTVFNSNSDIESLNLEQFIYNLVSFLNIEGEKLLKGDKKKFKEINQFLLRRD